MSPRLQVEHPPERPLLIFDGDCAFCRFWVQRWRAISGNQVQFVALQDPGLPREFPQLSRAQLETAVHLVTPDGHIFAGAEAVIRALAAQPSRRWLLALYRRIPGLPFFAEIVYRFIANHREFFSRVTHMIWRERFRSCAR